MNVTIPTDWPEIARKKFQAWLVSEFGPSWRSTSFGNCTRYTRKADGKPLAYDDGDRIVVNPAHYHP